MAFDVSKDKLVREVGSFETEQGEIRVGVFSYNDGPHKVGIQRAGTRKNGESWSGPIGRMTKDETRQLIPLLEAALHGV